MDNKEEIRRELNELSPTLGKMEKKSPFKTPDYYFQSLPDRVMERARSSQTPALWFEKLEAALNDFFTMLFRPRFAIPASAFLLSLVVAVGFFKNQNSGSPDIAQTLSEISSEEITKYAMDNFDDDDLMALNSSVNGFIPDEISNDELEDFLNNNTDSQNFEEDFL